MKEKRDGEGQRRIEKDREGYVWCIEHFPIYFKSPVNELRIRCSVIAPETTADVG